MKQTMYSIPVSIYLTIFTVAFLLSTSLAFGQELSKGRGCEATASIKKRTGSDYVDDKGKVNAVYDLSITNIGSCDSYLVSVQFSLPSGASIVNAWNLQQDTTTTTTTYQVKGYGTSIEKASTYEGSGVIISFDSTNTNSAQLSVAVTSTSCLSSCISNNNNNPSTTTPSSAPSSGYTGCPANATITLKNTYKASMGDGTFNLVYDITFTNISPSPLTSVEIYIPLRVNSTVSQTTSNMEKTCCTQIKSIVGYNVTLAQRLAPSSSSNPSDSGFIYTVDLKSYEKGYTQPAVYVINPSTGSIC